MTAGTLAFQTHLTGPGARPGTMEVLVMPLLIVLAVVAVVAGLFASRRVALGATAAAGALVLFVFTWAVADGKGDDPWWLILVAAAACAVALLVAAALPRARGGR